MPPQYMLSTISPGTEVLYAIVVLFLCLMVYLKTREVYILSKHKGISFFRYAFLFFGLAYASRLILYFTIFDEPSLRHIMRAGKTILPVFNLVVAYFSTMAILYLTYSLIWKKIETEHFLTLANITALFVGILAFIYRSPTLVMIIQSVLIVIMAIITIRTHKKSKKKTHTKTLYLMIAVFWLINLFALSPKSLIPFEVKSIIQLISIGIFVAIYHKVTKWTK